MYDVNRNCKVNEANRIACQFIPDWFCTCHSLYALPNTWKFGKVTQCQDTNVLQKEEPSCIHWCCRYIICNFVSTTYSLFPRMLLFDFKQQHPWNRLRLLIEQPLQFCWGWNYGVMMLTKLIQFWPPFKLPASPAVDYVSGSPEMA